jgi:hypothetical protein
MGLITTKAGISGVTAYQHFNNLLPHLVDLDQIQTILIRSDTGLLKTAAAGDILENDFPQRTERPPQEGECRSEQDEAWAVDGSGNMSRRSIVADQ